ncbi:MAG: hypothetical protein JXB47_13275, partial [Anaerolineae bacterium]|nr:hypothetical protein [Anaerolineae bacterium]
MYRRNNPFYRAFTERSTLGCLGQLAAQFGVGVVLIGLLVLFMGSFHQLFGSRAQRPTPTLTLPAEVITVAAFLPTRTPAPTASEPGAQIVTPAPTSDKPALARPLYFLSDRVDGRAQVFVLRRGDAEAQQVTDEPDPVLGYALHPAGMFLVAYTERRVVVIFEDGRRTDIVCNDGAGEMLRGMALAPDGRHVAIWTGAHLAVYRVDTHEQPLVRVVSDADWAAKTTVVWRADGAALAYAAADGVYQLGIEARDDAVLTRPGTGIGQPVVYEVTGALDDGRWL